MQIRLQSTFLLSLLLFMTIGCVSIYHADITQLKVIPISTVISDPDKWEEVGKDIQEGREIVFHIREGEALPLKVNMALPVARLDPGDNSLIFTHDTYLLLSRSTMRISADGRRWADVNDFKSQKALFGFDRGVLSVGLHATKEEGTYLSVDVASR